MKLIILVFLVFSAVGCTTTSARKNIYSDDAELIKRVKAQNPQAQKVMGDSCGYLYFIIPWGFPDVDKSYDAALAQTPGANVLLDAEISHSIFWIPVFYLKQCFVTEGIAVTL